MKIRDLIIEADSLLSDTFGERADITRVLPNRRREILPFNLNKAMINDPENNMELESEDEVIIYNQNFFFPERTVSIAGAVQKPGSYVRMDSMTVTDLVVMAGGLTDGASKNNWELAKLDTDHLGKFSTIRKFDVTDHYWDDQSNRPIYLKDYDHVVVPTNPKFNLPQLVTMQGYVMYPGAYVIQSEGERLASFIKRAGGLRSGAYLEGATMIRRWKALGLVPIDFKEALADTESSQNITMMEGDIISIPVEQNVVLVRGEVFVPAAVVYKKGASLKYYIHQAGGYTENADDGKTIVTLPNGRKWEPSWGFFLIQTSWGEVQSMCRRKLKRKIKPCRFLTSWATVMASIATMIVGIIQITK